MNSRFLHMCPMLGGVANACLHPCPLLPSWITLSVFCPEETGPARLLDALGTNAATLRCSLLGCCRCPLGSRQARPAVRPSGARP